MTPAAPAAEAVRPPRTGVQALTGGSLGLVAIVVLVFASLLHVGFGAKWVPPSVALDAIFHFDPTIFDHLIIVRLRIPRLLAALAAGACLGLAGATIQAVTRNPLAGPGVLGMNSGAALAVVAAMTFAGIGVSAATPWIAAAGAIIVFTIVMAISSAGRAGPTPFKVTLAGVAVAAFASSITAAILMFDEATLENVRLWLAGSLGGPRLEPLRNAAIPMLAGGLIALAMSPQLNALALGEKAATGLGVSVKRARMACLVATALLAGSAVSAVGPIGFIGLVVPHIVKLFVPTENRLILPLSAVTGALTLVLADLAARVVLAPQEIATGIMTALLGAPIFVILVRARL